MAANGQLPASLSDVSPSSNLSACQHCSRMPVAVIDGLQPLRFAVYVLGCISLFEAQHVQPVPYQVDICGGIWPACVLQHDD
jgi:hypothetical protein